MTGRQTESRVLVTGGAGFIGSHLVRHLLDGGRDVVVIDDLSTGRASNLDGLPPARVEVLEGTVSARLGDLDPGRIDRVYHLAAAVGVRLVVDRPIETIETNVLETSAVLRFAGEASAPLFLASTSEVYGKSERIPFAEDDDVVYGPTTLHRWSYACSKAIDEYLALAWYRERDLPVVIGRFFNTVGPGQVGQWGMVLPRFVAAALEGSPLEVHGDGRQSRCFCDVRDVVRVVRQLLEDPRGHGRVYNIGHDESITIAELAARVLARVGGPSQIVPVAYETVFGAGFEDLRARVPDLSRLRAATGWRPEVTLDETIDAIADRLRSESARQETH
jgi:UDP-glucose 4-epimerase